MRRPARRLASLLAVGTLALSLGTTSIAPAATSLAASPPGGAGGADRVRHGVLSGTRVDGSAAAHEAAGHGLRRLSPDVTFGRSTAHRLDVDVSSTTQTRLSTSPEFTVRQSSGFEGLGDVDEPDSLGCPAPGSGPCVEPPDPWIGVGPNYLVQAVNTAIRVTSKSGAAVQADQAFGAFFAEPPSQVIDTDPHVVYDAAHGRWLATALSFDCTAGHLYLGVTDGNDPRLGHWTIFQYDFPGAIPDYPGLGWSSNKIVVSVNEFAIVPDGGTCDGGNFIGAALEVADWADATDGDTTLAVSELAPDAARFAWRPAQGVTDAAAYLVGVDVSDSSSGDVRYATITGTNAGTNVALASDVDLTTDAGVDAFDNTLAPVQRGAVSGTDPIDDAVDFRPTDAVWRSQRLWFVATSVCDGGLRTVDCARYTELDTSAGGAEVQTLYLGATNGDVFMAGIGLAGRPDATSDTALHSVFSYVNPTGYVATYSAYRFESDAPVTIRSFHMIRAGLGHYAGERWGDYVGVASDPSDATSVWQADQYPTSFGSWGTWVSKLTVAKIGTAGVTRDSGASRYETAVAVSSKSFPSGVPVVYIATGKNFPDALAGGPAAALEHGPLLLVAPDQIPAAVKTELTRLAPKRIVVLGGTSVVTAAVMTDLQHYTSGTVTRVSGPDRYATAAAISSSTFPRGVFAVFLATGKNFPDALSGGPAAAYVDSPLLLVSKDSLPAATKAELARLRPQFVFVLGGTSVISAQVQTAALQYTASKASGTVIRLQGGDRYETGANISGYWFAPGIDVAYVATGANFPDALSGGPAAALEDGALVLVTKDAIPSWSAAILSYLQPKRIVVLGGTGAVSSNVMTKLSAYVVP